MAEADWTLLSGGIGDAPGSGETLHGVTFGIERPNSSGPNNFIYGFNSTTTTDGAVGVILIDGDFVPTAKGASVRGAIQRGVSDEVDGFSPMMFVGLQGGAVTDLGYLLGLSDEDPHRIIVVKGPLSGGAPAPPDASVLMVSSDTFLPGTWLHLRLDMTVNLTGDVLLDVSQNDLDANPIGSAPDWQPVDGMSQFVDDALAVNSGSLPFLDGRVGLGFHSNKVNRRGYFDHVEAFRQL
jgi:hypothetical protein